jgi:hypothetical protein
MCGHTDPRGCHLASHVASVLRIILSIIVIISNIRGISGAVALVTLASFPCCAWRHTLQHRAVTCDVVSA